MHVFRVEERPPQRFARQIQALRAVQDAEQEMDSLRAIRLYSEHVIKAKGEFIDSKRILPACKGFCFRTAAEKFRIIETDTVPVYIPTVRNGALLDVLRAGSYTRRTIRSLQRDSVNVYREHAQKLMGAGKVEETRDGFLILADPDGYDPYKGLSLCDDPGQAIFL